MNLPVAPIAALFLGAVAATGIAVMPAATLEGLVMDSGIPAILAAAEPPLGTTARLALAAGVGGAVALVGWFALFILIGSRGFAMGRQAESDVPVLRRADAHPDAPARAPLRASRDLGTPFLEVTAKGEDAPEPAAPMPISRPAAEPFPEPEPLFTATHRVADEPETVEPVVTPAPSAQIVRMPVEQALPVDLDQPLSAFDPEAIPDVPMPPPVQLPPLRRAPRPAVFDATERFETFDLTPLRRPAPSRPRPAPRPAPRQDAIARPETDATIHALLERLERGVVRRSIAQPVPTRREAERGLEDALVTLRNLARRA